jgi:hypothetical protein
MMVEIMAQYVRKVSSMVSSLPLFKKPERGLSLSGS